MLYLPLRYPGGKTNRAGEKHRVVLDEASGRPYWVFYELIPSIDWTMGVVFAEEEILPGGRALRRARIWLALSVLGTFFFLGIALFRLDRGGTARLWGLAVGFSLLCCAGIILLWFFAVNSPSEGDRD